MVDHSSVLSKLIQTISNTTPLYPFNPSTFPELLLLLSLSPDSNVPILQFWQYADLFLFVPLSRHVDPLLSHSVTPQQAFIRVVWKMR